MQAGKLRHRVAIEFPSPTRDEFGGLVENWVEFGKVWAEIVPLSGREFLAAQAVQAGVTTRIGIRLRSGITAAMRIRHGSDIYNIKAVLPDPRLTRHLSLMCEMGVNNG